MPLLPSDRVILISEIARRLESEQWEDIDLILHQFGLRWTGVRSVNNRRGFLLRVLGDADDDVLLSLGRPLGYEFTTSRPSTEPACWRSDYFRLFVSHLAEHRRFAANVQRELLAFGVSSFVAHNDIRPTREWQDEIEAALATCDGMLALLHPGFHESKWADQEIGYAMGRQVLIVTARLGTDPYGFIGKFQSMNGNGKNAVTLAEELFDILREHAVTRARIAEAIAALFCQSDSFAEARIDMKLLKKTNYWNASLSDRVRSASESNRQISDAVWQRNPEVMVPQQLEEFLARMESS